MDKIRQLRMGNYEVGRMPASEKDTDELHPKMKRCQARARRSLGKGTVPLITL